MLFSERKRLREIEVREAKGEKVWTSELSGPLRTKLTRVLEGCGWVANKYSPDYGAELILEAANRVFANNRGEQERNIMAYLARCPDVDIPDIIESVAVAVKYYANEGVKEPSALEKFHADVNKLLASYRVNYTLEEGEITELDSREIHKAIISPTLALLGRSGWEQVEKSYQDALKELAAGNPSDAITDATTALQEALRKLGCKGKDLATLLKSAKNTIMNGYDGKYIDSIDSLISWCSANRSNRGDSHKVTDTDKDDAWFVVHTVGILILRLSKHADATNIPE